MNEQDTTPKTAATAEPKAKKAAKAKPAKKPTTERAKKEGIRKPQWRILGALIKAKRPLTRTAIKTKISENPESPTAIGDALGLDDDTKRKAAEKKAGFPSLLTLKAVKRIELEVDNTTEVMFEITATGRKLYEKYES